MSWNSPFLFPWQCINLMECNTMWCFRIAHWSISNNFPAITDKLLTFGAHECGASTHMKKSVTAHCHIALLFCVYVILINAQLLAPCDTLSRDSAFSQTGRSLHIHSEVHISVCLRVRAHHMFLYNYTENIPLLLHISWVFGFIKSKNEEKLTGTYFAKSQLLKYGM